MFKHTHPYPPYIPDGATKLIVGTLPPPRFTTGNLKSGDVDFCYGSSDGQLWKIIGKMYKIDFLFENTTQAVVQRQNFLQKEKIGICDMVAVAHRKKIDASDIGIQQPRLRPIINILKENPRIETLLLMGGNSKNGPEYFLRKSLKPDPSIQLKQVSAETPKTHQFILDNRLVKTVSLTAPSGAANRAVGSMTLYKKLKKENPKIDTIDFRVLQYRPFFMD